MGFAAVDITTQPTQAGGIGAATTWPGRNTLSLGGVARNMAESAHRILAGRAGRVRLISPVGHDVLGDFVRAGLTGLGMSTDGLVLSSGRTATVMLQLDASGDLLTGIADIDESQLKPDDVRRDADRRPARVVAFDGNISVTTMDTLLSDTGNVTVFEPTSVARCVKIIKARSAPDIMTPNEFEVVAMHRHAVQMGRIRSHPATQHAKSKAHELCTTAEVVHAATELASLLGTVLLVKGGARGVLLVRQGADGHLSLRRCKAHPIAAGMVSNTTGCGDTFAGAIAACAHVKLSSAGSAKGQDGRPGQWSDETWVAVIDVAQQAASLSLQSAEATSRDLGSLAGQVERICLQP